MRFNISIIHYFSIISCAFYSLHGANTSQQVRNSDGATLSSLKITTTDHKHTFRLTAVDILNLDASKITTGTFGTSFIANNAITSAKLASNSVDTSKLVNESVTTSKLNNNAVTNDKLASGAVNTDNIITGAVVTGKIADGAITTSKLNNNSVTHDKLASGAVDTENIVSNSITTRKIVDGAVTAAKLAPGAIGFVQIADNSITTPKIADGAVVDSKIVDMSASKLTGAITTTQVTDSAITDVKINDVSASKITGTIATSQIANEAITAAKIAVGNIMTDHLFDYAVTSTKLAKDAVGSYQIRDNAVTGSKIAQDAVGTLNIVDDSVTNAKIVNVSANKITGTITGSQIAHNTITNQHIANGTINTVNIANGAITDALVSGINASKITSGQLDPARFPHISIDNVSGLSTQILSVVQSGEALTINQTPTYVLPFTYFEPGSFLQWDSGQVSQRAEWQGIIANECTVDMKGLGVMDLDTDFVLKGAGNFLTLGTIRSDQITLEQAGNVERSIELSKFDRLFPRDGTIEGVFENITLVLNNNITLNAPITVGSGHFRIKGNGYTVTFSETGSITVPAGCRTNQRTHSFGWDVAYPFGDDKSFSIGSQHVIRGKNSPRYHSLFITFKTSF